MNIMEKPLISVVMSVYNDELYLKQSLDSIFAQTIQDFEVIIVDDASSDRTVEIINAYEDDRIRLYRNEENQGLTKNLNRGLSMVRGTYIARMDGDDICYPERFEKQIEWLEKHPDFMLISCRTKMFGEENLISVIQGTPEQLQAMMLIRPVLAHPGFMMRRELLDAGFEYDESYRSAQDYNFAVRVAKQFKIGITPQILLNYRVHKKQISSKKGSEQSANADRVRYMQLEWLGVTLDKQQEKIYRAWAQEAVGYGIDEYRSAKELIGLLARQNEEKKIYDQKALVKESKRLLFQWVIRSKSGKMLSYMAQLCGWNLGDWCLFIGKAVEIIKHKVSKE